MKFFKEIVARCWALWGLITFLITFLYIYPFFLISFLIPNKKRSQVFFISVSKKWMNAWLILIGCPLRIYGKRYFDPGKTYIVVFNHNTLMDIPLSSPYVPGANKTIAKDSFSKIPLFGLFYSKGSVLVNRKDSQSRSKSFEQMKAVLANNMHMCIYPEGTRNRTNELLKPFYDGAFKLSTDTGVEIIPCIIRGTKNAMPIHKFFYLFPTKLSLTFLPPVSPVGLTPKAMNEKVHGIMLKELNK